jgi:Putative transposase of IS4/5 family (DUF4096)
LNSVKQMRFVHTPVSIYNAILYVLRTGCPWRYLPSSFPPWQTVYYHFRRFRLKGSWYRLYTALRAAERERVGVKGVVEAESPLSRTTGEPLFPGLLPSKGGQIEVVVRPQEDVDAASIR